MIVRHYPNGSLDVNGVTIEEKGDPTLEDASYYRTFKDLFPRIPAPADVVQGSQGNCGMIA